MKKKKWDVGLFNLLQFIGASKSMKSEWKNNRKSLIRFALLTIFSPPSAATFKLLFFRWLTYWTGNWLIYCTLNTTQLSIFSPTQFSLGKSNKKILYSAKLKTIKRDFLLVRLPILNCFIALARHFKFLMKLKLFHTPKPLSRQSRWIQWCYSTTLNWEKTFHLQSRWFSNLIL